VRINGSELDVRATVRRLHGLSGHADAEQMCEWLVGRGKAPGLVVLNHGDEPAREGMERRVRAAGATDVARPALNATLALA
jgi:metallo-beta-lactamase family protein